jgi:hypothetical protein
MQPPASSGNARPHLKNIRSKASQRLTPVEGVCLSRGWDRSGGDDEVGPNKRALVLVEAKIKRMAVSE